ncbi:hypothetical protein ABZU90_001517 [Listeria monocytogenes]|nr:hypothetical protein [Listeria monocytogenes]
MEAPEIKVKVNQEINIATGMNKLTKKWKNTTMPWQDLLNRLARPTRTQETVQEYHKLSRAKRDDIKDVGGFVGGFLKQGRRRADASQSRSLVTLDADSVTSDIWSNLEIIYDFAAAVYSTHSHTPDNPRLRLIIPLARPVTAEEYQPLARKIADKFGMDNFDDTTYQPERLMFWPSCPSDGDYIFKYQDGAFLDPDSILEEYPDWTDSSYWPESSRSRGIRDKQAKKQGNPLDKPGLIGAFCNVYDIHHAIETFLPDVYAPTDNPDRYTYLEGSTSGGLVLYDDVFAYSHHGTDPVGESLSNAFDLVRIHLFGDQDIDAKEGLSSNKLPSFKAMRELALEDSKVVGQVATERMREAEKDFDMIVDENNADWVENLELDQMGEIEASAKNLELIFTNDVNLAKSCAIDQFSNRVALKKNLPWRKIGEAPFWKDSDDAGLRIYIEKVYGISSRGKVDDAFIQEIEKNAFHPVRDYLDNVTWDGVERLDTMLVDYLGALDSRYTRVVTRKIMMGAVARIYRPGIKFDYAIVTTGRQGLAKSFLPDKLAGAWFSDTLNNVTGKEAYEALQGTWIMELAEMSATKKADIEAIKHFISKREDAFRVAYGKHKSFFPRQCIFWGTSNDPEFLRDKTGNRRFWPVKVGLQERKYKVWEMSEETRAQLWAEAKKYWTDGESLFLSDEEDELATEQQILHTEDDPLQGMVQEYLNIKIPADWYSRDLYERKKFIKDAGGELAEVGTELRQKISSMEVWCELLDGDPKNLAPIKNKEIHSILCNISEWEKHTTGAGKLSFGKAYGHQRAYTRKEEI